MTTNGKWRNRIIETVQMRVGDLAVNKYNPKVHPASQETRVEAVLDKFGIVDSLIAWKSERNNGQWTIFDGHLRQKLDPDQVWTVHKTSLTDEEVDELVFYFDPLAGMSLHAGAKMAALMQDLGDVDGVLGEMLGELAEGVGLAFGGDGDVPEDLGPQIDRAAELQEVWQVKRGQVWAAGRHRLMCGDSTCAEDVERLMGGEKELFFLTDPPYCSGGFQEAGRSAGSKGGTVNREIARDTLSTRGYMALIGRVLDVAEPLLAYVFTDWRMWVNLFDVMESKGYGVRNMIVWDKGSPGMGIGWRSQHELIMFASKVKHKFDNHRALGNVINSQRTGNLLHSTEKPVDLLVPILEITDFLEAVIDPFLGSGTTLVACEQTARVGFGMEICEKYCSVALQRLKDMGLEPRLVEG